MAAVLAAVFSAGALLWWREETSSQLWQIVQRCGHSPTHSPCSVYRPAQGYALLKDREGQGQYLLLPLQRLHGIESPQLLAPATENYLQDAWQERGAVGRAYGRVVPDTRLSLALNSRRARSQDQLHIHIDCLRADVEAALAAQGAVSEGRRLVLAGVAWQLHVLQGLFPSPFVQMGRAQTQAERGRRGILITQLPDGRFVWLETEAQGLNLGMGEALQDHQCL